MTTDLRIAATIPAYEAERTIADVVRRTLAIVRDVVVVNDGSQDATAVVAQAAGARVLNVPVNRGKGNALSAAFADLFARGFDAVVTLDADGQHIPEQIPLLVDAAASGDLVIGSRDNLFAEMSRLRRHSNRISSTLISWLAGKRLSDVQCGFRLYRRELIEAIGFPEPRFEAESAVVIRAARMRFRIVTVPVRLAKVDGRATSHYRPIADSVRIANAVVHARMERTSWVQEPSS